MSDITYAYPLILNKVASPQYATPTLRRSRLLEWLDGASDCRAAVIAADAGYGKTTLLWQWEREAQVPCYWYKLDRNDRDWTFHISYLIEAISKRHEGFGRRAHSMLQQLGGPGSARPGVAAYLLAEMHERLTEPCTFIIDDWHYVSSATEVRGLWNQILRDAPPTCRFIFAGRVKPRLQFARFKTHAGYAELRTDALRFTESEIDELFRDIYNDPLDPTELVELERRTEGWAASLQLVEVSLRERGTPEDRRTFIQSITATKDSDLFDFLAEEVLDQQPEETRNFLLTTSILQQITPEVAERLAGVHDGRHALSDLEQRGLFTSRLDEVRYRYHNLFREFLERRLVGERSEAEVLGLHIHAASYFETTEQWPEAIHHYLRAKLQRQAARLIAKHGEGIVSSGRLGLIDEWLRQLPAEMIRQNARLNLLLGEAAGIRGEWSRAIEALDRARRYFSRKGDRRLEALACLKLSSVHSNFGHAERAAAVAEQGLQLAPADAASTRLRLEGNLAITRDWLAGPLAHVADECNRIATEAAALGLDHFAAIGFHNAGEMQLRMGQIERAIASLDRAQRFWAQSPTNPFGHSEDLVQALIADDKVEKARMVAVESMRRTEPWPRPHALALRAFGDVLTAEGQFDDAIRALRAASKNPEVLGIAYSTVVASLLETLYLSGARDEEFQAARSMASTALELDARHVAEALPSIAIAGHVLDECRGACQTGMGSLREAHRAGAVFLALIGRVKIGALAFEHRPMGPKRDAWSALRAVVLAGYLPSVRWWARRYAPDAGLALKLNDGCAILATLMGADPDGWRDAVVRILPRTRGGDRAILLKALTRGATKATIEALREIPGDDVAATYRRLQYRHASRLFLRTLGGVSIHRGDWDGPVIPIEKRRVKALLAVLAAHSHVKLTRDMAVDLLWPDADGDSGVNSLNQTVFQLRRYLDPDYRQGQSPEYVVSSAEQLEFADGLVRTDIHELRTLPHRLAGAHWARRQDAARRAIRLVRGEFLADLRYESWASRLQLGIHNEIRSHLLPIASDPIAFDLQVSTDAASALVGLDPFDEAATLVLAECMSRSGRRLAARDLLVRYAQDVSQELNEGLSDGIAEAVGKVGSGIGQR